MRILKEALAARIDAAEQARKEGGEYVRAHVISDALDISGPQYFERMTTMIEEYNGLSDVVFSQLTKKLDARRNASIRNAVILGTVNDRRGNHWCSPSRALHHSHYSSAAA